MQIKKQSNLLKTLFGLSFLAATAAHADHNSIWGEGLASMPNDIHNTRIDTMDDDTDSLIDFVSMGAGSDSVNRFLDDDTTTGSGSSTTSTRGGSQTNSRGGRS